jgi:Leucine-rich repeat (LRR) protein
MVGLELGVLRFVSMTNCGVPEDSFSSLLGLMGVGGVRSLTFKEGHGTIQPYHLQNLSSLAHLELSYNGITDIFKTFFEGTPNLTSLDLTGNQQLHLHENAFQNLANLRQLVLVDCGLERLEENLLEPLGALERLSLHGNRLSGLAASVFRNQAALTFLNLNKNQLSSLPPPIFHSLVAATVIDIGHNQFKSLPENLFAKNGNMTSFSLIVNGDSCLGDPTDCHPEPKLKLAGGVFRNTSFVSIKLIRVPLISLPADLLKGLSSVKNFTAQSSHVTDIPPQFFQVTILNLHVTAQPAKLFMLDCTGFVKNKQLVPNAK